MKEYGGYFELDRYRLPMLHEDAVALNCGRKCLAYLIRARNIRKLCIPYFMCDCVFDTAKSLGTELSFYHIDSSFRPAGISPAPDEWLYVMNYYGQLTPAELRQMKETYGRVIADNAQAYFEPPLPGTDTLYTCRKFFGVADGAFLYTDAVYDEALPQDESFDRMRFVLGRFERPASDFYTESAANNDLFDREPVKRMSKLTENLLHGIDYGFVKQQRTENFRLYQAELGGINQLTLRTAEGAFAYPLLLPDGAAIRKALQQQKIYIPTLWPNVLSDLPADSTEYRFAADILPLPCDQRYERADILHICDCIRKAINQEEDET